MRIILNYLELEYEEDYILTDDDWFPTKFERGMAFPNLPYLYDGDHNQTETTAIIEYLCAKY